MTQPLPPGLIRLADVAPEEVRWLWSGRIPMGKVTILEGHPGLGKSAISLDIAARLSSGRPLPGETIAHTPAAVLLLGIEDGLGDTVRPRIDAAGGDANTIFGRSGVVDDRGNLRPISLPEDVSVIERDVLER